MKLSKGLIWIGVIVVALLGVRVGIAAFKQPDDQKLIQEALRESIEASKEGRPGGVMDKLSVSLKFNDLDTSGNRRQIAQYIKQNRPDVEVLNTKAVITGDEARIVSPVNIRMSILTQTFERQVDEVTLIFRKEEDREFLVIPTRKWKLAEVRVPDTAVADFMLQ